MAQTAIPRTLDLALVIELEVLPIAGTLQPQTTPPQRFDGWLELIAAIETELSVARAQAPPTPPRSPS